jgi:protein-tyrosine phosphatase
LKNLSIIVYTTRNYHYYLYKTKGTNKIQGNDHAMMSSSKDRIKIIFVCLGNYCRSPMAEAIFNQIAAQDALEDHFEISSAGTKDWDVGLPPDYRTRQILADHNIPLNPQKRAQKIRTSDLAQADYLIAMSERVAKDLNWKENVYLLMDFVDGSEIRNIPDPYPTDTFPQAFNLIEQGVTAFYEKLKLKYHLK